MVKKMINRRTTSFDTNKTIAAPTLECRDGMCTAEEIYNRFVKRAREVMNYKNNKKEE